MKPVSEKKQDLLFDALSCIDENILARGLALRDGEAVKNTESLTTHLFDLSELDRKPPKRNRWRAILVAAAIIALLAAVPLSSLLIANRSGKESPEAAPPYEDITGDDDKTAADTPTDISPESPTEKADDWEENLPGEPVGTNGEENGEPPHPEEVTSVPGVEENTELGWPETDEAPEITYPDTSSELLWTVLDRTNGFYGFRATSHAGRQLELIGTVQGKASDQVLSPEDEMALKLIGQWMLSVYTLDYEIHFPLFPDEVIAERILPAFEEAGLTYEEALEKINRTVDETYGIGSLNLSLHLVSNELLTGSHLEEYRRQFAEYHPEFVNVDQITSVRKVRIADDMQIIPDGKLWVDPIDVPTGFYCYEYEGRWYLDDQGMLEDDLCMDLLGADSQNSTFYQSRTWTGEVISADEYALYLKEGLFLLVRGSTPLTDIMAGDTVTVTYHGLGVTFLTEESDGLIQPPNKTATLYILDSVTIADP